MCCMGPILWQINNCSSVFIEINLNLQVLLLYIPYWNVLTNLYKKYAATNQERNNLIKGCVLNYYIWSIQGM